MQLCLLAQVALLLQRCIACDASSLVSSSCADSMEFDTVQCLYDCVHCMQNLLHPTAGNCLPFLLWQCPDFLSSLLSFITLHPSILLGWPTHNCHICNPLLLLTQHVMQVLLKRNTKPPELPTSGTVRKVKAEDLAPKVNKGNGQPFITVVGNGAAMPGSASAASMRQ